MNHRESVSAITLWSGKQLDTPSNNKIQVVDIEEDTKICHSKVTSNPSISIKVNSLPFPTKCAKSKKMEQMKEILETLFKLKVNIPLLDAIKQKPRYSKFLKESCTTKRKLRGDEKISVRKNVSAILQRNLSSKCKDSNMFTIPCRIGNARLERAMLDSGASINVISLSDMHI